MPRKPKRPCSYPGCPKLVDGQYCEEQTRMVICETQAARSASVLRGMLEERENDKGNNG